MQNFDQEQTQFVHHQITHISFSVSILIKQKMKTSASESVRFFDRPSSKSVLEADEKDSFVRFLEILTGPPSESVLEADGKGSSLVRLCS